LLPDSDGIIFIEEKKVNYKKQPELFAKEIKNKILTIWVFNMLCSILASHRIT
jgi:hypothetical protein